MPTRVFRTSDLSSRSPLRTLSSSNSSRKWATHPPTLPTSPTVTISRSITPSTPRRTRYTRPPPCRSERVTTLSSSKDDLPSLPLLRPTRSPSHRTATSHQAFSLLLRTAKTRNSRVDRGVGVEGGGSPGRRSTETGVCRMISRGSGGMEERAGRRVRVLGEFRRVRPVVSIFLLRPRRTVLMQWAML